MMRWTTPRIPQTWLRSGSLAIFLLFGCLVISHYQFQNISPPEHPPKTSDSCIGYDYAPNVVVSVKTGATEALERIPTLMRTSLHCIPNTIIFSDLSQDIGEYHLYDALDTVSRATVSTNPDFEFYSQQQELWESKRNVSSLRGVKNPENPGDLAAWRLDKYKFLHLLEKTWKMKPDMDWYFVIDADTYVLWPDMLNWLRTLNPSKKTYFGSVVVIEGVRFAHGGSGIILSRAAMFELVVTNNGTASKWDAKTFDKCCGDLVLSMALGEHGMTLEDVWPLMTGETPFTMPFGPATPEYWCRPALTMHHVTPADMEALANFERRREGKSQPLTHAELFKNLLYGLTPSDRENWDNLASDKGEFGKTGGVLLNIPTFEGCTEACARDVNCFQYSHHDHTCSIGMSVRVGYAKDADNYGIWRSGWNMTRLEDWLAKQPLCDQITFPAQTQE